MIRHFLEHQFNICTNLRKFEFSSKSAQIATKIRVVKKCKIVWLILEIFANFAKLIDELLLEVCEWRGAKGCKSNRSRRELSNENLIVKSGFYTAENDLRKVWIKDFADHIIRSCAERLVLFESPLQCVPGGGAARNQPSQVYF